MFNHQICFRLYRYCTSHTEIQVYIITGIKADHAPKTCLQTKNLLFHLPSSLQLLRLDLLKVVNGTTLIRLDSLILNG